MAVFWIATAWLATGLYVAPLISGQEPKFQRFGVNFLYICLLIIVVGSFAGEWLGINQAFTNLTMNFWFGHQGYEYVDLGRSWQIFLFVGLLLWLVLMFRALLPAGLWQTYNVGIHGYWFVRSAEFIHSPLMEALVWGRVPGDVIFAFGAFALCWAMLGVYNAVRLEK